MLRWALAHRPLIYAGAAVVLVVTVRAARAVAERLSAQDGRGPVRDRYTLPPGASLAAAMPRRTRMERSSRGSRGARDGRLTGVDTNGYSPTQTEPGHDPRRAARTAARGLRAIAARLRDRLTAAVPAATLDFHQMLEDRSTISPARRRRSRCRSPGRSEHADLARGRADGRDREGARRRRPVRRRRVRRSRAAHRAAGRAARGARAHRSDLADALGAGAQGNVATQRRRRVTLVPVRVTVAAPRRQRRSSARRRA